MFCAYDLGLDPSTQSGKLFTMKSKKAAPNCDKPALAAFDYSRLGPAFAKLGKPAQRALINAKIFTPADLKKWHMADVAKLHGIGPSSLPLLKAALRKA